MKLIVPRTCTEIRNANTIVDVGRTKESRQNKVDF